MTSLHSCKHVENSSSSMGNVDLLSDQGIRMDGRRPNELRKVLCKLGVSEGADGSSYVEQGYTKVLATVYGPHAVSGRRSKAISDRAVINCQFRTAPFSGSSRSKLSYTNSKSQEMTIILRQAFESAILTSLYPGSQIDIFFLVLYSDGSLISTCINAGTLAIINAGIPIRDYLCACSAGFINETALMDINHIEGFLGGAEMNLAILKKSEAIVCSELSARIHKDHMNKIRKLAIQGCKDIYEILDAAVKKHSALIQPS